MQRGHAKNDDSVRLRFQELPPDMIEVSPFQFRNAMPQDVEAAVPLINSSGTRAIDYGFLPLPKTSCDFLRFAFIHGKGFLGHENHTVALIQGRVVGIAAFYNFAGYARLTLEHLWQLWRFYPASSFAGLVNRGVHLKSVMPPPGQSVHYVANFGVNPDFRGIGIGTGLLDHQCSLGLALGRNQYALDVSVDNPRAQALYNRYGFTAHAENQFSGPLGVVPNTLRMTMPLKRRVDQKAFKSHPQSEPI